ncbi:MAG: hypothetical protein ACI4JW_00370 [Oscillospiraceae bacterium]
MEFGFNNEKITKALLRTTIKKSLADIKQDPKRSVRNLVDLGLQFAEGENQRALFDITRTYLSSENSAYFRLAENIVNEIDHDKLTNYGLNFGYNGCTKGARMIREKERLLGCHIPFLLAFSMGAGDDAISAEDVAGIIRQGMELGIFIYAVVCFGDDYSALLDMAEEFDECAFLFFVNPQKLSREEISHTSELDNVVTSVRYDGETDSCLEKVKLLREQGCITCVHFQYRPDNINQVLTNYVTEQIAETGAVAAILYPDPVCDKTAQKLVFDYKKQIVRSQQYPMFMFEAKTDIGIIENMFSNEERLVVFSDGGKVQCTADLCPVDELNMHTHSLVDILKALNIGGK